MLSPVEQVKSRLNISDVVGAYLKLDPAGSNFKARCPFHQEKTPSFFVSPTRQSYHCFGCNRGGDMLSFVQEIEGLDFMGALKILADRAGVTLSFSDSLQRDEKERYYSLLEAATQFFSTSLDREQSVKKYLLSRGLLEDTIKSWRLGFAPEAWRQTIDHLTRRGFREEEIVKAGLARRGDNGVYDWFRRRIMFPIADGAGRIVGFSGRIFSVASDKDEPNVAKYVNTPETIVYHKSNILHGYDRAKTAIRKDGFALLVEGQMDLVLAHQAGTENTVATSGTALTVEHLSLINRLAEAVVIAFDGDLAGRTASRRAVVLALQRGLAVRVALLPRGTDPADMASKNPESWSALIDQAVHVIDFLIATVLERELSGRDIKLTLVKEVLPYVALLPSKMEQAHFVAAVARAGGVSEDAVWTDLVSAGNRLPESSSRPGAHIDPATPQAASRRRLIEREIFGLIKWQEAAISPSWSPEEMKRQLSAIGVSDLPPDLASESPELALKAELTYDSLTLKDSFRDLLNNLEIELAKEDLELSLSKLRRLRPDNHGEAAKILAHCELLSRRINNLRGKPKNPQ